MYSFPCHCLHCIFIHCFDSFVQQHLVHKDVCKPPKWNESQCGDVCKGSYILFVILIRMRKYRKYSSVPSVLNSVVVTNHWM